MAVLRTLPNAAVVGTLTPMPERLDALRASVAHLNELVTPLTDAEIVLPAYPSEWTIAQVLSHLGSGAVIFRRNLEEGLRGGEIPDDFNPQVWDEWNAKTPRRQVDDGLSADAALLARYVALTEDERGSLSFPFGPMTVDFDTAVGLRLNEHTLHTWDVEVVLDPSATLPDSATADIVDGLPMIAGFAGKPSGEPASYTVATSNPARVFDVALNDEGASLTVVDPASTPLVIDLDLPAEAIIRLVYGRLDPAHTPEHDGDEAVLNRLRKTFPGF